METVSEPGKLIRLDSLKKTVWFGEQARLYGSESFWVTHNKPDTKPVRIQSKGGVEEREEKDYLSLFKTLNCLNLRINGCDL